MSKRPESGGTLAFIAAAAIIIVIVGIGFFLFARLLGGGQEAQEATDSGNLNVAKQALLRPFIQSNALVNVAGKPELNKEFHGCFDPKNDSVNLQYYNKIVGKAFLVAMNASAEGTQKAFNNAKDEIALVQGAGGIGEQLAAKLAAANNTEGFFKDLAHSNDVRMLNTDQNTRVQNDNSKFGVGYMLTDSQAPSNLYLKAAEQAALLPPGAPPVLADANNAANRSGKTFLVGYHAINIASVGDIQFVPMRPGEQPHLVSQKQFGTSDKSPIPGGPVGSLIPPNCFQSSSLSRERQTSRDVSARSSAIVGVVDTTEGTPTTRGGQYPPQIPGFILIDNSLKTIDGLKEKKVTGLDKFSTTLMKPSSKVTALDGLGQPHFDPSDGTNFDKIKNATKPVPLALGQNVTPPISNQQALDGLKDSLAAGATFPCDNTNSASGSGNANCQKLVSSIPGADKPTTAEGAPIDGLMPIEAVKLAIINVRASGAGCETLTVSGGLPKICGALKAWNPDAVDNNIPFSQKGTVQSLLAMLPNGNAIKAAIGQRMSQMAGRAINPDGESVFNSSIVEPGVISAIFFDIKTNQFKFATGTAAGNIALPSEMITSTFKDDLGTGAYGTGKIPDGNPINATRTITDTAFKIVDVPGDGGYPTPYDCPPPPPVSNDIGRFFPSSGYDNLLGVLEFSNCVDAPDGTWCCPC